MLSALGMKAIFGIASVNEGNFGYITNFSTRKKTSMVAGDEI